MTLHVDWKQEYENFDNTYETCGDVAERLGCTPVTVARHFREIDPDIVFRPGPRPGTPRAHSIPRRVDADWPALLEQHIEGRSLRDIGAEVGCSYELVRLRFKELDPDFMDKRDDTRENLKRKREEAAEEARIQERLKAGLRCVVCTAPVYRVDPSKKRWQTQRVTCSQECSKLWVLCRYRLDPSSKDAQRAAQARYILRNPDKVTSYNIRWAKRYLAGEAETHSNSVSPDKESAKAYERAMEKRRLVKQYEDSFDLTKPSVIASLMEVLS